MPPNKGDIHRADEVIAEAIVTESLRQVRATLNGYDRGELTVEEMIFGVDRAIGRAVVEVCRTGWPFFFARKVLP